VDRDFPLYCYALFELEREIYKGGLSMNTKTKIERTDDRRFVMGFCIPSQVKVLFSIVSTLAWIGGSLYWIAFLGRSYTFFQNVALLMIAFMVFCVSNAVNWMTDWR
jgi:hypothetical protein